MSKITERYEHWLTTWSDIQNHLPVFFSLAQGNIVELGTRDGVSTSAFLAGVEERGGRVFSIDINPKCEKLFEQNGMWRFICSDSADHQLPGKILRELASLGENYRDLKFIDILFIDTEHTFEQCSKELQLWKPYLRPGAKILLHDTESFPEVLTAMRNFCTENNFGYDLFPGSNGLGQIEIPTQEDTPA